MSVVATRSGETVSLGEGKLIQVNVSRTLSRVTELL